MLSVCATPIGNLDDVTLRVLAELRDADLVLAEDTRHTRGLLQRHGIEAKLLSYHEHNEAERVSELLPRLLARERLALVSDAGLPGISDPGARLVRAAVEAGVEVTVLPGPSAVETALKAGELAALWEELGSWDSPVVAFESPQRLPKTLRSLAESTPERQVAVCRELTKRFEEIVRGDAEELAERFAEPPKGEITLVLGPAVAAASGAEEARTAVAELVAAGTPRRVAVDVVARLAHVARNELYRSTL
jgi:16S rRNA (cytidine1402-2'-O)-methyltransferase